MQEDKIMSLTKDDLAAIGAMIDSKLESKLEPISNILLEIRVDIDFIKNKLSAIITAG